MSTDKEIEATISTTSYLKVALSELPLREDLQWIPYYFDGDEIKKLDNKAIQKIINQAVVSELEALDKQFHPESWINRVIQSRISEIKDGNGNS